MRRSDSIFDSRAERDAFVSLQSRWTPNLALYPQLPLSKLVNLEAGDGLTSKERQFFFNTNVDYTFCTPDVGLPLLAIEFDGIGGGYSSAGVYHPVEAVPNDPLRTVKLDFKLRCSRAADMPLVVVSYNELARVDEFESLTVLDGIVAQFVSRQAMDRLVQEFYERDRGMIDSMDPDGRDLHLETLVWDAEFIAEQDNDPLAQAQAEAWTQLNRFGETPIETTEWLFDPPLPDASPRWPPDPENLWARIEAWNEAQQVGARAKVPTRIATIEKTVWIRNVGHLEGVNPHKIAEHIALLRAFRDAAAQMGEHFDPIR